MIHLRRCFLITLERLVFAFVPAFTRFLNQPCTMADHALYEIMGHLQALLRPVLTSMEVTHTESKGKNRPCQEKEDMKYACGSRAQHCCR